MKVITGALLQKIFPSTPLETLNMAALEINAQGPGAGLTNPKRMAAFIAQVGHESQNFLRMTENLNYSAKGLMATWPKRFNATTAAQYQRKPEAIANKAYANRYGNGDEASGDGWKYRGRGWLQITFKDNYMQFATFARKPFGEITTYLQSLKGACHGALWYWTTRGCNALADAGKIDEISQVINGGNHGLEERRNLYTKILKLIA